jgi:CubicO group peptidase (beta-lactamase class C family)
MCRLRTVLALVILTTAALAQTQSLRQRDVYQVERILSEAMTVHHIPGASIGVVVNGVPVWTHGYGMADLEGSVEARDTTLYRLASVSKPLSAVAAMTLVEHHKLDLDAPVQQYCPAFPQKQWPVTVRELLSHTAGVRHYNDKDPDIEHGAEETRHFNTIDDALPKFAADPLLFQPSTKFNYSTYGYTVVGCAIEGASGENFYDYLRESVLSPAGMTHTVVDNIQTIVPNRARGYDLLNGQVINAGLMDSSYKIPGGGLVSNVDDMANFIVAMLHNRIVSAETAVLMWTPLKTSDGKEGGYGLGFGIGDQHGWKAIAHTGGQKGTSTIIYLIPEKQFGVAILTNLEGQGGVLHETAAAIADELLNSPTRE